MDRCYSGDNIAENHLHTDITTCNIEEPQQKYRLERSVVDYWGGRGGVGGGGGLKHV